MTEKDALSRWKSQAWHSPDMVVWYSQQMVSTAGINALKNAVELDILDRHVRGEALLDIGVGTGRGSLPFARRGLRVTGIDSSAAMLDETRRLAAGTPIELKVGDVVNLPVGDGAFDTAMALNVMVHVPRWQEALDEWLRVVRPGGRIIFDVNSLDHLNAAYGTRRHHRELIPADSDREGFARFMLALARRDVEEYATARGLALPAVVPYGLLASDSSHIPWQGGMLRDQRWWLRLLSWVAEDPSLFSFCMWVERRLLPVLPTAAAGRFMVVIEKPAAGGVSGVSSGPGVPADSDDLAGRQGLAAAALRAELEGHLGLPRCRLVAYVLFQVLAGLGLAERFESLFDSGQFAAFRRWQAAEAIDRKALLLLNEWPGRPELAEAMSHEGVPLGPGLAYDSLRAVLREGFGVFQGEKA